MNNREKLKELLKEMFRFGDSELDFGIYRIMNQKREEINEFIEEELDKILVEKTEDIRDIEKSKYEQELKEIKSKAEDLGIDYTETDRYKKIKDELDRESHLENLEAEIYKDIYKFFKRYYDKGDFISQRRYSKENKYAIPYNGEEVHLHWANKDQYYIKTTEEFDKYSFEKNGVQVNFRINQAKVNKNNNKSDEDRYFILKEEDYFDYDSEEDVLDIYFEYRNLTEKESDKYKSRNTQDDIRSEAVNKIRDKINADEDCKFKLNWLVNEDNKAKSELESHLYKYTTKNERDYFIHKNLQQFLERELDFYIKNEVMDLDSVGTEGEKRVEDYLGKVKIIKDVCNKIIKFLAQIEDFQKKLFNKKKFVLDTEYCLTLDKVPEEIREDIFEEVLNNDEQLNEWEELYNEEITSEDDLYKNQGSLFDDESLKNLVIDTKHFNPAFNEKLLSNYDDISEVEGLMLKSENYQALQLLQQRYNNNIKSLYLDPPFNSRSSEILYKNNYKHASWLSLMNDRLLAAKSFLHSDSVITIAIDEHEQERLGLLLEDLYPQKDKTCVTIIHNPSGQQGDNFSYCHEYAYFIYPYDGRYIGHKIREKNIDVRNFRDVTGEDSLREAGKNCFYPVLIKNEEIIGFGEVCDNTFHPNSANIKREDGVIEVYPIDPQGIERKWRFARQTVEDVQKELKATFNEKRKVWDIKRVKNKFNHKTVWTDSKYSSNNHGTQLLNKIIGKQVVKNITSQKPLYPKSIHNVKDCIQASTFKGERPIILDFFAGSGTTAHAAIELDKNNSKNYKYILMEMGDYFNSLTKTRIKKIMYSEKWEDGNPKSTTGNSHIFKYQTLEQYEDTLENVVFKDEQMSFADKFEDYKLNYMLDYETKDSLLDIEKFAEPFSYEIKVMENKQEEYKGVDLIETFNYLIGLEVHQLNIFHNQDKKYKVIEGEKAGDNIAVIWRNTIGLDLEQDAEFIESEIISDNDYDKVYINGDNCVVDALLIERVFKNKMFEEVEEDISGGGN